ncbi:transglycosylase domain-containing protein [Octadecabacter sp. 1_MG-2023]|uniref:transglycosylase domain-containing protein n=1 Tax=unclassified Octadecabacter TaxID=196158 RepID=UPI001C091BFC|nr:MULTISPECIES: transglycosylase domain-containing protein [unclassified Octadecabacter]MBU2992549.1 transglycosylase domain-containing protein [Octadecabacter sp. B2R22]MDO6734694.1 transglycosylase domain-containing protein [Octadecabacter sp. 1_MG-2023]
MTSKRGQKPPLVAEKRSKPAAKPRKPAKSARRKPTAPKRRGLLGTLLWPFKWLLILLWRIFWRGTLVVSVLIGIGVFYYASTLPPIEEMVDGRTRGSVTLLDARGETFAWRGDQFAGMIRSESVSDDLRNAIIATEDKRFYAFYHFGVDFYATAAAMARNFRNGGNPLSGAGGSSITQQTAKLLCFGRAYDPTVWETETDYEAECRRTTLWRKVQEAVYAFALETRYTKEDILTIYINRAYLGAGSRGFEAASQRYFGISAAQVNPAQSAMLAGLLKAPSSYAPTRNLQVSQDRGATVIRLMEEQGYLTSGEAADAQANPATLSEAARARAGGYFADWVMDSGPSFFTEGTTEDVIIRTTLDPRVQTAAEEALVWVFENKVRAGSEAQAAIVVMSADGAVRAMVGGRDLTVSGAFNRATQALRQTGSAFKPFIYAAALDIGMSPFDILLDAATCWDIPGPDDYCPTNYTNRFEGEVTMVQALQQSLNIPAVALSELVGRPAVRAVAEGFGIDRDLADGPALALGVSESTLLEMTGAYAGILNGGSAVKPYGLTELRLAGDDTPLLEATGGIRERVIQESAARELTWMMYQVVEDGSGRRAAIEGWEIAGKTGTTQGARDAWFIGFSGDYVTGIWMGYDNNTPLTGVTGSGLPAEIWHETMTRVLAGLQPTPLPMDIPAQVQVQQPQPSQPSGGLGLPEEEADNLINDLLRELQGGN